MGGWSTAWRHIRVYEFTSLHIQPMNIHTNSGGLVIFPIFDTWSSPKIGMGKVMWPKACNKRVRTYLFYRWLFCWEKMTRWISTCGKCTDPAISKLHATLIARRIAPQSVSRIFYFCSCIWCSCILNFVSVIFVTSISSSFSCMLHSIVRLCVGIAMVYPHIKIHLHRCFIM